MRTANGVIISPCPSGHVATSAQPWKGSIMSADDIQQYTAPAALPKKEDIPYEMGNAREWEPKRRGPLDSSCESSDDDQYYSDSDFGEGSQGSGGQGNFYQDGQDIQSNPIQFHPSATKSKLGQTKNAGLGTP